jgi:5-methylcytosine-specific restriction endonuclease McrA
MEKQSIQALSKPCKKCGSTERYSSGGCKPCARLRSTEYRKKNPEKARSAIKKWEALNKEKVAESNRKWVINNRDKVNLIVKRYAEKHPDLVRERYAAWYEKNRERVAKYRSDNRQRYAMHARNRIAKKLENGGVLSFDIAEKLYKSQRGKCVCCGLPLGDDYHIDHIIPLSLGGRNDDTNVQLLRKRCNLQKSSKHPIDFMRNRGFLL